MIDRDRLLAKLDELDGYLRELRSIAPQNLEDYRRIATKRACERLIQVAVEAVIDACAMLVTGLRLGVPGEEDDLFTKLSQHGVVPAPTAVTLRRMKGLRTLLVHEYGRVDEALVFDVVNKHLDDFEAFKRIVLAYLRSAAPPR